MYTPDDPMFSLEENARTEASELVDLIVMSATGPGDVQRVIDELIAYMRDEWSQVDWNNQGEYGYDFVKRGHQAGLKARPSADDDGDEELGGDWIRPKWPLLPEE